MRDRAGERDAAGLYGVVRPQATFQHTRRRVPPFAFDDRAPSFAGAAPPYIFGLEAGENPHLVALEPLKLFARMRH